ncbi:hypothetical protein CPB86DRAFT_790781 [Serendipita vermifera]|nr:hypothetical protein CPB86DRAFT_790781 [Serendipita vermifera]
MPNYRVRPGSIPKHLKLPLQPPVAPQRTSDGRPPIRNAPSTNDSNATDAPSAPQSSSWFTLPRFRAQESSWFSRQRRLRDIAKAHPHARLRDPKSVRIYDLIAKTSVPILVFYFLFYAPAGEHSDVAILRRWSEGFQQDVWDWWNNVPGEKEVDPQIVIEMERRKTSVNA